MRTTTRFVLFTLLVAVFCLILPQRCPAPLVWRKGEGWTYERTGMQTANTPKEQLDIGRRFQEKKDYGHAVAAYRRVIARWPTSLATQDARLGLAESLTQLGYLYKAFKEYQNLIDKHPNSPHFDTVLERQYEIGSRFLAGEKNRVWWFRIFSGLGKAGEVFERVVKNGPYSKVGPDAQFRIGLVFEKQKDYISAVHAYDKLLERYPKLPLAETAQFEIGWAYRQEAARSEYDQNNANQAIASFSDFLLRYPNSRMSARAEELRTELKQEQSRGLFQIGQFYEKNKNYKAASIYYNEVIEQNPKSDWANTAQRRITALANRQKDAATTTR
jgi:outer membrane protein assembly factor BamD